MKHRLRKYERKLARQEKKQKRGGRKSVEDQGEVQEVVEEEVIETKKPKKIHKSRKIEEEEPEEELQLDQEIEALEQRLGLRDNKSKTREKNWKKIKKQLALDGLGSDFYDLLEGKAITEEDQQSIEPVSSPEIELVGSDQEFDEEEYSEEAEEDENFENFEEESKNSEEALDSSEELSTKKKQKLSEVQEKKIFIPQTPDDLQRKLKGLLNRLSDQNIEPITNQIAELYRSNSNISLNQAFWDFLHSNLIEDRIPTQLLAVYSAEIAALSKIIGREIAAFMIDKLYSENSSLNVTKASMWGYLYYFNVFTSDIIMGFIKFILLELDEARIEILITIFTLIGFTLRKKEPALLKELINATNEACRTCTATSTRMRYMIEFLTDIKNNKKKQNLAEERLKFLKNWLKNSVTKATGIKESQITAKWTDLNSTNWRTLLTPSFAFAQTKEKFSPEIEALARSQHMTTESRKHVFCLIMSSEDYMDAFAKLSTLKKMERDIVRVLITCCGQEGVYNKFYTLVSIQLCKHLNSYKYSFQYALWDHLKQFQDFSIRKISNISKMFSDMIINEAVDFSILKAVDFDDMNEHLSLFLRILIEHILVACSVQTISQLFGKCSKRENLKEFCDGIRVFLKIAILPHPRKGVLDEIGLENFESRAKTIRRALKLSN